MKYIPNAISQKIARQVLLANKNSPTILFGAGVVGVIGTTVLASKATLKLDSVLSEIENDVKIAKEMVHPDYSEDDRKKDITIITVQGGIKIVKLYGPALIVGGLSIAALTKSHSILNSRNAAITAAYTALDKGFAQYRARVVDELGDEKDQEFRYGTETVKVKSEETGKTVKVRTVGKDAESIYARFFDENSSSWSSWPEENAIFLKCQQNWANDMLQSRGHLFLNEVYRALGIPHSSAGAVVGWVLNDEGDNYVDFGIFNGEDSSKRFFVNNQEVSILLDFNVDGVIYELIDDLPKGAIQ